MSAPPSPPSAAARAAAQHLQRGIAAAETGDAAAAIAAFRQAVALDPGFGAAHANLGLLLVATGQAAQAVPHLEAALARVPSLVLLHNALGVARDARGELPAAERSFRAAVALKPDYAEAHKNLGICLRRQGRLPEARACHERALALQPDFVAAHCALGNVLQDLEDDAGAIACYRAALAQDPQCIEALNNLGSSLRRTGALPQAREAFERVLALRPDQIETHTNLAQLKTYAPGDPQIDRLLALEPRLPSLPEHGQQRWWFTAGKMLEDTGRHDEAFAAYAQGNRLKHARAPWDEAAWIDHHRRLVATFTRERLARADEPAPGEADEGPIPVFIVGMPRSGTSLLEQVLSTLPGVHGAGEIPDLPEVEHGALADHPAGVFTVPEGFAGYSNADFRRLGRRYLDRIARLAPGATHVVDKLPENYTRIGLVHLMLPRARIVHAMRDPMDSCFSCFSRLFNGDNLAYSYDLETLGRAWLNYDDLMRHWRAALPPGRLLEVAYETMVADFEAQARRLVEYLGLPWDARCLEFHRNERVVKTASVAQVRRPLYGSSVARWKPFERHLEPLRRIVGGRAGQG